MEAIVNNIAHLFMLFSFLVLYLKREDKRKNSFWQFTFVIFFALSVLSIFPLTGQTSTNQGSVGYYKVISGIFAGLSIALITGRIDSKFLSVPFMLIIIFYIYSLIQTAFGGFDDNIEYKAYSLNIALVGKSLLMILFAWLTSTNRLLYYLITVNRNENETENNLKSIAKYF